MGSQPLGGAWLTEAWLTEAWPTEAWPEQAGHSPRPLPWSLRGSPSTELSPQSIPTKPAGTQRAKPAQQGSLKWHHPLFWLCQVSSKASSTLRSGFFHAEMLSSTLAEGSQQCLRLQWFRADIPQRMLPLKKLNPNCYDLEGRALVSSQACAGML